MYAAQLGCLGKTKTPRKEAKKGSGEVCGEVEITTKKNDERYPRGMSGGGREGRQKAPIPNNHSEKKKKGEGIANRTEEDQSAKRYDIIYR